MKTGQATFITHTHTHTHKIHKIHYIAKNLSNERFDYFSHSLEPKTHHQTLMTCTYGYSHFINFKTVATEVEI